MPLSLNLDSAILACAYLSPQDHFSLSRANKEGQDLVKVCLELKPGQSLNLKRIYAIHLSNLMAPDFNALFRRATMSPDKDKEIKCILSLEGGHLKSIYSLYTESNFSFYSFYMNLEIAFLELSPSQVLEAPGSATRRTRSNTTIPVSPFPEQALVDEIYKIKFSNSPKNKQVVSTRLRREITSQDCAKEFFKQPRLATALIQLFEKISQSPTEIPSKLVPLTTECVEEKYVKLQPSPKNRRRATSARHEHLGPGRHFFSLPQVRALRLEDLD